MLFCLTGQTALGQEWTPDKYKSLIHLVARCDTLQRSYVLCEEERDVYGELLVESDTKLIECNMLAEKLAIQLKKNEDTLVECNKDLIKAKKRAKRMYILFWIGTPIVFGLGAVFGGLTTK